MSCTRVAAVCLLFIFPAGLVVTIDAAESKKIEAQKPTWEAIWDSKRVDAGIRRHIRAVDSERMSKHLFYLAKKPLPYRKLNFTLPDHKKNTLYEAGYPVAVINIGSWPYGDPNYHTEGDITELCDVQNAAMTVRATLAAILTLDQDCQVGARFSPGGATLAAWLAVSSVVALPLKLHQP